jgi:HD-GYP domain-containing protein (c-di-GMP phosphodiesterase class II)
MSTARPYRRSLGLDAAVAEVSAGRGTRFDAAVVDAFLAVQARGLWVPEPG